MSQTNMDTSKSQETAMFVGPIIHSVNRDQVTIVPRAAIVVVGGKIKALEELTNDSQLKKLAEKYSPDETTVLENGQYLIPGFIDSHTHAPQFPNAGLGYDKPLLDWLNRYTFPLENQYSDVNLASRVYSEVVKSTLQCGTTTAVYFGTVHRSSCTVLAREAHSKQQRALVGKVCMDMNCIPPMTEETQTSIEETEAFIDEVFALKSDLVRPVITPRFAITCSGLLLAQLAQMASKHNLHVQTHLAENKEEVKQVRKLFPNAISYADVYDQAKLLNRKTILAHCVLLEDSEVALVRSRGASVAHCPNSNICLQSGLCDVRRLLDAGVNVALGTDVAGGCNHLILDAIRCCLSMSITLSFSKLGYKPLSHHEAFYLATMGGAIALDMERELGNFVVGKYFDALLIDTSRPPMLVLSDLTLDELFQKFIYTADDRNIVKVYVNGKLVVKKI